MMNPSVLLWLKTMLVILSGRCLASDSPRDGKVYVHTDGNDFVDIMSKGSLANDTVYTDVRLRLRRKEAQYVIQLECKALRATGRVVTKTGEGKFLISGGVDLTLLPFKAGLLEDFPEWASFGELFGEQAALKLTTFSFVGLLGLDVVVAGSALLNLVAFSHCGMF